MEMIGRNLHLASHALSPGSPPSRKKYSSPTSRSIYRAPQASIRRDKLLDSHKAGSTRRRRREPTTPEVPPPPPPPPLEDVESFNNWMEHTVPGSDELGNSSSDRGVNPLSHKSSSTTPNYYRRTRTLVLPQRAHEDFSETYGEGCDGDESAYTANTFYSTEHFHNYNNNNNNHKRYRSSRSSRYNPHKWYQTGLQFLVLVVLAVLIFDSHSRVRQHKVQLQQYDDERAHILEQMMWIDQAAKKVHKKYAQNNVWNALGDERLAHEEPKELLSEAEGLRDALKRLQLRVQLNARDRIEQQFGEHPVHVKFTLNPDQDLEIALTDDTPHAASILLEQVNQRLWDTVELQKLRHQAVIQVSTNLAATHPVLEFVESSHSCREAGSVVFRQLEAESMELNVVVLRVHLEDDVETRDEDVCIGKVVKGMEYLHTVQDDPMAVPVIQEDVKL